MTKGDKMRLEIIKDKTTGMLIGFVDGIPGLHSRGRNFEELKNNLKEVLLLLEEGNKNIHYFANGQIIINLEIPNIGDITNLGQIKSCARGEIFHYYKTDEGWDIQVKFTGKNAEIKIY